MTFSQDSESGRSRTTPQGKTALFVPSHSDRDDPSISILHIASPFARSYPAMKEGESLTDTEEADLRVKSLRINRLKRREEYWPGS